jgi:hypothetical protein
MITRFVNFRVSPAVKSIVGEGSIPRYICQQFNFLAILAIEQHMTEEKAGWSLHLSSHQGIQILRRRLYQH